MVLALAFFARLGNSYRTHRVNPTQATFEGIINYLADLAIGTLGPKGERYVPTFVGIFFFIWMLNQFGLLPFKQAGFAFGGSPTADLNTTAAFALTVFFGIQFVAIRQSGIKAYAHLFKPFPKRTINIIEEIARPVVLAMRLAFNIAGDLPSSRRSSPRCDVGPINLDARRGRAVRHRVLQLFHRHDPAFVFTSSPSCICPWRRRGRPLERSIVTPESLVVAVLIFGFAIIVFGVAVGSAIGDGIVASKAVEAIARQPEARGNIFTFFFLGVGILEAFPIIALVLGFYLFFVVANVPSLVATILKNVH